MPEIENPLVSVIIPSYNSRHWVGQAIDSVLNQTYPNVEIIVVDDGSTDGTADFLRDKYGDKIKYIYQPNGGLGNARNTGIRHAEGNFISFLDADDLLLPEKIAHQVQYFREHPEYGVVYCNLWCVYEEDTENWHEPPPVYQLGGASGDVLPDLLKRNLMVPHAAMIRRECLDRVGYFYEQAQGVEDWDLWLRLAGQGFEFGYLDERAILYRVRQTSMSHNNYKMRLNLYRVFAHIREAIPAERLQPALAQTGLAGTFEFGVARASFEKKQYAAGYRQAFNSLRAARNHRLAYSLFCIVYLLLLPVLGYYRLEKLILGVINQVSKVKSGALKTGLTSTIRKDKNVRVTGKSENRGASDPVKMQLNPRRTHNYYYHLTSLRKILEKIIDQYVVPLQKERTNPVAVDMGCGSMPYRSLFAPYLGRYIGADIPENTLAEAVLEPETSRIELEDASVDLVISTQVLEHVNSPRLYLEEAFRICKAGGLLILSTHGHWMYHPTPQDFWRWTSSGLKNTIEQAGFEVIHAEGMMGLAATGLQFFQEGLVRKMSSKYTRGPFIIALQTLIALADKVHSQDEKNRDASVFIIVARKPLD